MSADFYPWVLSGQVQLAAEQASAPALAFAFEYLLSKCCWSLWAAWASFLGLVEVVSFIGGHGAHLLLEKLEMLRLIVRPVLGS